MSIVQCLRCGNMEYRRSVFCRICGERLANPGRERFMKFLPWAIMVGGIALVIAFNIGSQDTRAGLRILVVSLLLVIGSHRAVAWTDRALHYRAPLYREVAGRRRGDLQHLAAPRRAGADGADGADPAEEEVGGRDGPSRRVDDSGEKAYKNRVMVGIYDRNIGLLLDAMGDSSMDGGYLVGKVRKADNFYERNRDMLSGILGGEEYGRRRDLFAHIIDVFIREGRDARVRRLEREFRGTVDRMILEVESLEARLEAEDLGPRPMAGD